jgi:hypothetical protein
LINHDKTAILILALRERTFKEAGFQNFIFQVSQGKTPYSYCLKTCQIAVFSFPCIVPVAWHKRIFYNFKALNGNTFPFFAVPCYLNPQFPKPKYNISHIQMKNFPTKAEHLPNSNAVAAKLKRCRYQTQRCRYQNQTPYVPRQK